jgi:hypothetical protein
MHIFTISAYCARTGQACGERGILVFSANDFAASILAHMGETQDLIVDYAHERYGFFNQVRRRHVGELAFYGEVRAWYEQSLQS